MIDHNITDPYALAWLASQGLIEVTEATDTADDLVFVHGGLKGSTLVRRGDLHGDMDWIYEYEDD